jgi:imidazolonepropionase-like amidohydrolase
MSTGARTVAGATRTVSGCSCLLLLLLLLPFSVLAQRPSPAPAQSKSILLTGGTVHVGDGRVIDEGAVGFRAGVIDYVGYAYGVQTQYDSVINVKGQHVYPGFIAADAVLGLLEIEQVRATDDKNETGELAPEARAITAYNVDSRVIPTVRSNGVLLAQIAPRTGTIAGTSSIVQLDAWDNLGAVVRTDDGIHMNWPSAYRRTGWWAEPGETSAEKEDERSKRLHELRAFFNAAKAYADRPVGTSVPVDLRMAAMRGLFDGSQKLYVNANVAREIQEAVLFVREMGVKQLVIVGGHDAWRVAQLLKDNDVPVVLRRLHSLPMREDEDVDLPYRLPALLKERGVRFCLGYAGDMEHMGVRNLPFLAGTAAAYGLGKEEALASITLEAARILGIEQRCGSLEKGKEATVIVSTGDALDMRTNHVVHAFIQGRHISLNDHHKALYEQYKQRHAEH